jgi:hypothetical protein
MASPLTGPRSRGRGANPRRGPGRPLSDAPVAPTGTTPRGPDELRDTRDRPAPFWLTSPKGGQSLSYSIENTDSSIIWLSSRKTVCRSGLGVRERTGALRTRPRTRRPPGPRWPPQGGPRITATPHLPAPLGGGGDGRESPPRPRGSRWYRDSSCTARGAEEATRDSPVTPRTRGPRGFASSQGLRPWRASCYRMAIPVLSMSIV